jgi:hypothetical protein
MGKRVKSIFNIALIIFLLIAFLYFFYKKSIIEGLLEKGAGADKGAGSPEEGRRLNQGPPSPEEGQRLNQLRLDFCDEISKYDSDTLEGIYNYIFRNHLVLNKPEAEITAGFENQLFKNSKDFKEIVDLIKKNFIDDSANVSGYKGYFGFMVVIDNNDSATDDKFPVQRARNLRLMCNDEKDIQKFYEVFYADFPERNNNGIFKDIADENTYDEFYVSLSNYGKSTIADIYTCLDLLKSTLSETENPNQEFFKTLQLPAI